MKYKGPLLNLSSVYCRRRAARGKDKLYACEIINQVFKSMA